jgi:hypothetical protein
MLVVEFFYLHKLSSDVSLVRVPPKERKSDTPDIRWVDAGWGVKQGEDAGAPQQRRGLPSHDEAGPNLNNPITVKRKRFPR